MPKIDGMIVQSDGSKPLVVFIMNTLAKQFPYNIWKIGGMVPRTTRSGDFSFHSTGQACDIYLDASDPLDKVLGDLLFDMLHQNSADLEVSEVIWNGQRWYASDQLVAPYTNAANGLHTDHIHVGFGSKGDTLLNQPTSFTALCEQAHKDFVNSSGTACDQADGLYGKAFDPKKPNTRLTLEQRRQIMAEKMGFKGL